VRCSRPTAQRRSGNRQTTAIAPPIGRKTGPGTHRSGAHGDGPVERQATANGLDATAAAELAAFARDLAVRIAAVASP